MLDKFLVLLERFVVAHELIAANSAKQPATLTAANNITKPVEIKVEGEDVIDTKAVKGGAKPEPEDDLDDEEPEEKPKQKRTRGQSIKAAAEATKPKGPDVAKLREEIKTIAKAIAAGDSDECADKFDELLEDYKVRTVTKLADEDVEAFHKDATKLVGKYYEIED
ncbi:hypothetical protein EW589_20065 [Salmonella enterica subsp. enterica serovar Typhimurium]|nr:hypothetical protein [Salmonella enterica]EBA0126174.1 hypothetical protein [Salmonella enterica subsp. enterica serovar Typhimurium]EBB4839518.1 hypothetical protein [Salmonella enterica subsp. enterica serovar Typhimurium]